MEGSAVLLPCGHAQRRVCPERFLCTQQRFDPVRRVVEAGCHGGNLVIAFDADPWRNICRNGPATPCCSTSRRRVSRRTSGVAARLLLHRRQVGQRSAANPAHLLGSTAIDALRQFMEQMLQMGIVERGESWRMQGSAVGEGVGLCCDRLGAGQHQRYRDRRCQEEAGTDRGSGRWRWAIAETDSWDCSCLTAALALPATTVRVGRFCFTKPV